jgi:hypothetical protein
MRIDDVPGADGHLVARPDRAGTGPDVGAGTPGAARSEPGPSVTEPAVTDGAEPGAAVAERARLVEACVDLGPALEINSPALWRRLRGQLARIGVEVIDPRGATVDHDRDVVLGVIPTADAALVGSIAQVTRFGYRDHGTTRRPAEVTVHRLLAPASDPPDHQPDDEHVEA